MILERIGKFCFFQIRPSFFYMLLLLPPLLCCLYLFFESLEMKEIEERFQQTLTKGHLSLKRKELQERFLKRYANADPYFLDQNIESLLFLQTEKKLIEKWLAHPATYQIDALQERLKFLLGEENQIRFIEQNVHSSFSLKETEEKQRHSVQVDETDIAKLLSLIEDVEIGEYHPLPNSPQILVQNFHLQRVRSPIETEVFMLEMNLLKREFSF